MNHSVRDLLACICRLLGSTGEAYADSLDVQECFDGPPPFLMVEGDDKEHRLVGVIVRWRRMHENHLRRYSQQRSREQGFQERFP